MRTHGSLALVIFLVLAASMSVCPVAAPHPPDDLAVAADKGGRPAVLTVELRWNDASDLDLHVTGPGPGGRGFKLDASKRLAPGQARLQTSRGGGGPEVATIFLQRAGIYQFYVHDFTPRKGFARQPLSASGATVTLFRGGRPERTFEAPAGKPGNTWSAFALRGKTVTLMGTMSDTPDPDNVGRTLRSALLPGDILLGRIPQSLVPGAWSHVALYAGDGRVIEAASEDEDVGIREERDWDYPGMKWVTYLRVVDADRDLRGRAVAFGLRQVDRGCPYDIRFYSKQRHGGSWYCSELVWAAYLEASSGSINLEEGPDMLGVYPWEIEASEEVAYVGGHYEREPKRTAKIAWLYVKLVWDHACSWLGEAWAGR